MSTSHVIHGVKLGPAFMASENTWDSVGGERHKIVARAGLRVFPNQSPYFFVSAEIYQGHRDVGGGCCHDDVLAVWPELAPIVALHLAREDGEPMHAIENALWHCGYRRDASVPQPAPDLPVLARHLRVSEEEAAGIAQYVMADHNPMEAMRFCVAGHRDRWAREAREAIKLLDRLAVDHPAD